jgi:hypothetical protein
MTKLIDSFFATVRTQLKQLYINITKFFFAIIAIKGRDGDKPVSDPHTYTMTAEEFGFYSKKSEERKISIKLFLFYQRLHYIFITLKIIYALIFTLKLLLHFSV